MSPDKMTSSNEIRLATLNAFAQYKLTKEFVEDNRDYATYKNIDFIKLKIYYADDDKEAGFVTARIVDSKHILDFHVAYRNTSYAGGHWDMFVNKDSTFEQYFKGRPIYMASTKDNTKWRVDINQKPSWDYNVDEWNTYFKDVFDSNWDNVGKYYYEFKSKLPFNIGKHTLRSDDSGLRWVILKDGMLMNLDNHRDKAEFDDTVTLQGIPIMFVMLHMLPRVTKFDSKVDIIQKLKDRIDDKYAKSVIVMQDNGDLRKYTFTSCHVYWGAKELTIDEIDSLILRNRNAWNGQTLKRLPE